MLGSGNPQAGQAVDVAGTCSMFCVSTDGIVPELSRKGTGLIFNSGTLPDTYFYWATSAQAAWRCAGARTAACGWPTTRITTRT